jgi:hypothetical protein
MGGDGHLPGTCPHQRGPLSPPSWPELRHRGPSWNISLSLPRASDARADGGGHRLVGEHALAKAGGAPSIAVSTKRSRGC